MSGPDFRAGREDARLIERIAVRARSFAPQRLVAFEIAMDLTAAHNERPLRLADLLTADDEDFAHDVFGIVRHLDRATGALGCCFVPRFALREERT